MKLALAILLLLLLLPLHIIMSFATPGHAPCRMGCAAGYEQGLYCCPAGSACVKPASTGGFFSCIKPDYNRDPKFGRPYRIVYGGARTQEQLSVAPHGRQDSLTTATSERVRDSIADGGSTRDSAVHGKKSLSGAGGASSSDLASSFLLRGSSSLLGLSLLDVKARKLCASEWVTLIGQRAAVMDLRCCACTRAAGQQDGAEELFIVCGHIDRLLKLLLRHRQKSVVQVQPMDCRAHSGVHIALVSGVCQWGCAERALLDLLSADELRDALPTGGSRACFAFAPGLSRQRSTILSSCTESGIGVHACIAAASTRGG
eukprot:jgi/Bigna1/70379/fgenesh1_pg.11_\